MDRNEMIVSRSDAERAVTQMSNALELIRIYAKDNTDLIEWVGITEAGIGGLSRNIFERYLPVKRDRSTS